MPTRNLGGRPPKYNEPSRPITVTLPESTLKQLERVAEDRGQAIVKAVNHLFAEPHHRKCVEIVGVGAKSGLVVIGSCAQLAKIPFLHLVEVAPARFLLAIDPGQDFAALELALHDLLDSQEQVPREEVQIIQELLATIRQLRRDQRTSQAEILLVKLD
jgi:hypothetical protein